MRARRLRHSFVLALLALGALACEQLVQPIARVNFLTVEQERQLGEQFAQEVRSQQPIVRDPIIADYVSDLGHRLSSRLREPEFRYTFQAVADPSVNAFNIGGGYVFVHTGLIGAAGTEGQVASVMAHEIGHQVERHVAKMISRQQLFQTLAQVAIGANSSQWVQLAASLGITTGQLYYGRDAERQADEVMVVLMARAGYDPREALAMFELLRSLQQGEPGRLASFFSSHPPTAERLEAVRRQIAGMNLPADMIRDSKRFQEVRARVTR